MEKKIKKIFVFTIFFTIVLVLIPITLSKYRSSLFNNISFSVSRAQYTIKFDSNGGTGTMSDMSVKYAVSQNLTSNTFTKSGFDFIGWNTVADGSGEFYADGQEISYATTVDGDEITLYAQWFNKDYLNDTTELNNYTCTEEIETFTAPITGNYVLEAWGAQGGSTTAIVEGSKSLEGVEGGRGGYSYGVVNLNAGDEIYVAVGCKGQELKNAEKNLTIAGGYNGGGLATSDVTENTQASGGGATHFAINQNLGELKNYESAQNDVLVVAGGGGGSYASMSIYYYSSGGAGGGLTAGDAQMYYNSSYTGPLVLNSFLYYRGRKISGATQSLAVNGEIYGGTFGKGADAIKANTGLDAGAGGGWYGGNKLAASSGSGGMAGSGGSGHINTSELTEGETIAGNVSVPTHDGSSYMIGNTGDGYARISFVNPKYKVKFNSNGGTGTMSDMNFVYGTAQSLTNNTFTRTNFVFDSWNTEPDGSGTTYTDGQQVNNLTTIDGDEITLYAQWTPPKIYFQMPPDWSGDKVYAYLYNSSNNTIVNGAWNASTSLMTLKDSDKKIYQYEFSSSTDISNLSSYDKLIFSNDGIVDDGTSTARRSVIIDFSTSDLGKVYVPELYNSTTQMRMFGYATTLYLYTWNSSSGSTNAKWPGVRMQNDLVDGQRTHVQIVNISTYNRMIINQGSGQNQTEDITIPKKFTLNSSSVIAQDLTFKITGTYINSRCPSNCSSSDQHKFYSKAFRYAYYGSWHDYSTWINTDYTTWNTTGDGAKFRAAQATLGY